MKFRRLLLTWIFLACAPILAQEPSATSTLVEQLATRPQEELERMYAAGKAIQEIERKLASRNKNVITQLSNGRREGEDYDYPPGGAYDDSSQASYFYHSHRNGERGHFHTFLWLPNRDLRPQPIKRYSRSPDETYTSLVALSLDRQGELQGLFIPNLWVTEGWWLKKHDLLHAVDLFQPHGTEGGASVDSWIRNVFVLFRPQIEQLIDRRDHYVKVWRQEHPTRDPFDEHENTTQVIARIAIDVEMQMAAIEKALG